MFRNKCVGNMSFRSVSDSNNEERWEEHRSLCVVFFHHNHGNYKKFNENLCVNDGNIRVKVNVFVLFVRCVLLIIYVHL